jgi:TRAP-type C4-dicarboxylate transport system permease small subunit
MDATNHAVLRKADRALRALERAWMFVACVCLFAVMIIITADVAARYFFRSPLSWSFDLVSLYLMPAIFFLALSDTLHKNHHVNVDIIFPHISVRTAHVLGLVSSALATIAFAAMGYVAAIHTWEEFRAGNVASGAIQWPSWVGSALVLLGTGLLLLRLVFRVAAFAVAAGSGAEPVPGLEPPAAPGEEI